ncbi:MAG TPA: alpha-glucosidase [Spirochaetales bacterium]|nr:alpha-glucosidase [Spirochaetales bacterium]HRY56397.1 alpha-glucosidase [Spirochaetia bacterium]
MKIVLIGAGSAQFGFGTLGDIFQSAALAGSEIALVDIDGAALERVRKAAAEFVAAKGLPFAVTASTERAKALAGADFVLISIEVGDRFALWDMDWKLPLQYGIRQVYGENGGPGGLFHALRIIPPILDICADVEALCPEAFVFCYSNPMTAIVTTVLRRFPGLRFVGLCHEIASLGRYLPGILGTPKENLRFRAAGLNHCSVLLEASYADSGKDAYPDILRKAPAFFEKEPGYSDLLDYARRTGRMPRTEGAEGRRAIDRVESARPWSDRLLFKEILERFGLLPITTDSHLGEYIAWAHEAADHRGILDFYAFYRESLARAEARIELELKERVVPIMEGIIGDLRYEEAAVNLPNEGLIPDLPGFVAVEVPALVGRKGLEGHRFASYPKAFGALLRNYCGVYDLTAEAVLKGSRELAIQALLVSPVACGPSRAEELVELMVDHQRQWLGYLK